MTKRETAEAAQDCPRNIIDSAEDADTMTRIDRT